MLLLFHSNSGYANTAQCYVKHMLPVLLLFIYHSFFSLYGYHASQHISFAWFLFSTPIYLYTSSILCPCTLFIFCASMQLSFILSIFIISVLSHIYCFCLLFPSCPTDSHFLSVQAYLSLFIYLFPLFCVLFYKAHKDLWQFIVEYLNIQWKVCYGINVQNVLYCQHLTQQAVAHVHCSLVVGVDCAPFVPTSFPVMIVVIKAGTGMDCIALIVLWMWK